MSISTYIIRVEGGLEKDFTALGADIVAIYDEEEPIVANALTQIFSAFKASEIRTLLAALSALFTGLISGGIPGVEAAAVAEAPLVVAQTVSNAEAAAQPVVEADLPQAEAVITNALNPAS